MSYARFHACHTIYWITGATAVPPSPGTIGLVHSAVHGEVVGLATLHEDLWSELLVDPPSKFPQTMG